MTINPAVSSQLHWASIEAQERQLQPSAIDLRLDPGKRRVLGVTTNVARLRLQFPGLSPAPGLTLELDGQKLENVALLDAQNPPGAATGSTALLRGVWLIRERRAWRVGDKPSPAVKSGARSGPFREAFKNHLALVYATQGTPEENAWTLAKARYDAETFYYRGNATIELMADVDLWKGGRERQGSSRNLILYGHGECNAAWSRLLRDSPVQVTRGRLRVGTRELTGEDLGCVFLRPHPADDRALVGVVGGTGMPGMRVTERMPYFTSGTGFPDCLVIGADLPAKGLKGLRAAGFFGQDWGVETGEFAWSN